MAPWLPIFDVFVERNVSNERPNNGRFFTSFTRKHTRPIITISERKCNIFVKRILWNVNFKDGNNVPTKERYV